MGQTDVNSALNALPFGGSTDIQMMTGLPGGSCYDADTGSIISCPIAGSLQSNAPSSTGPLGSPSSMSVGNLNWALIGVVIVGLTTVPRR